MEQIFNYPHCGKIISKDFLNGNSEISEVTCPHCGATIETAKMAKRNSKRKNSVLPSL